MFTTRRTELAIVGLALAGLTGCTDDEEPIGPAPMSWTLVWADEFDGEEGALPDPGRWSYDIGATGWGNNELQNYTDRAENASLDGEGSLAILAREEAMGTSDYTSARINTAGKLEQAYGSFEARIKLPTGQGIWPAFWMLGADFSEVGWPECGEIDIMEHRGQQPWVTTGSLHGPGYSGGNPVTADFVLPGTGDFFDDFHLFRVDWTPEDIAWFVDGEIFQYVRLDELPGESVFDHPFFLILNVAVGGNYVGSPDEGTEFPQTMLVDFVRVYEGTPQ